MTKVRVRSPAKINLFLRVLARRPDGYHDIETLFQAIDVEDRLTISKSDGATAIEVHGFPELETEDNLVLRAVRCLEERTGARFPVTIRLDKRIPVAAGLGGGSSNAAAALVGICALFDLPLSTDDLACAALRLGADVPFFLAGGAAVGEGIGERLTPVNLPIDYPLVLVNPGFPVSTAEVYRQFSKNLTGQPRTSTVWTVLAEGRAPTGVLHNDLQEPAERLYPEITELCRFLRDSRIEAVLMSGSGPTVFGVGALDRVISQAAIQRNRWNLISARPLNRGVMVE
ncbi:MAG: 4-(cytidine 5'-diphospho)-2-C-methyl-D-erythritol kinase [Desulfomonile tiedjei]|nr:4-(cytidine 5'-diphospho)-2-C-methyl-D-erythritol kinase [Desulfomonile tiedjei]